MATCDKCGETVRPGHWPFCPHGAVVNGGVQGDEMDFIAHNLGPEPVHIRSRAQLKQIMAERGLESHVRHVPHPEGPSKNHTIDFTGRMDPYTAANTKELLERSFAQPASRSEDPYLIAERGTVSPENVDALVEKMNGGWD